MPHIQKTPWGMSARLLRAAGIKVTPESQALLIESAPTTMAESEAGPERGFCATCLNAALAAPMTPEEWEAFCPIWHYWLEAYPRACERQKKAG